MKPADLTKQSRRPSVLHVVGLFSPDNAYGGPVTVALNLAAEQRRRGSRVVVVGGFRGWSAAPMWIDGQRVSTHRSFSPFQRGGLHGLFSPGLLLWVIRHVRRFDLVHVHLTRDLTTLPAAVIAKAFGVPYVLQPHGQVDRSARRSAQVLDAVLTRRVLRGASAVTCLTPREERDLLIVERRLSGLLQQVPNGVPVPDVAASPEASSEVLFAARLHPRKRAMVFVEAAVRTASTLPTARFVLAGADEGDGASVEAAIAAQRMEDRIHYVGALGRAAVLKRMAGAAMFVLPSLDEVFPMTVLEALATGLPVVMGRSSAMAGTVQSAEAGIIVSDEPEAYTAAIERLMSDPDLRQSMGRNARILAETRYGMRAAATRFDEIYGVATD